jgi:hypothetical protein
MENIKLIALGVLAFCGGLMFAAGFILIFMR